MIKSDPICRDPVPMLDIGDWRQRVETLGAIPRNYADALKSLRRQLDAAFAEGAFIGDLLRDLTCGVDILLQRAWTVCGLADASNTALLAVGGYGRAELHPASDVDILILVEHEANSELPEAIGYFVSFLWDMGLNIGHSVRTLDECLDAANHDLTIATNLIEARHLAGTETLVARFVTAIRAPEFWPSRTFLQAKLQEQKRRYERFGETAYRLEPNLKESPGGLRDIQLIGWIARRHFDIDNPRELIDLGVITAHEYETLCEGRNFLWRIRYALHNLSGRKEDRLLFDFQRTLAQQFGYTDAAGNLGVERFMQGYFRTVMRLERLIEMLLQYFEEEILFAGEDEQITPINRRFQLRRGYIEARTPEVFEISPPSLLEVFLLLEQMPEARGVRASTIRLIRKNLFRIDEDFRNDTICRALFMEILRQPRGVFHELKRMSNYGVLGAYLPIFEHVTGRMQFDLFHIYTVDEHILTVVSYVRRLGVAKHRHELPECSKIYQRIQRPEVLYLAALFHDIGKGRNGDHSELGAVDAREFCLRHNLSAEDSALVEWLVAKHLLMSLIAQRKDISDPDVIREFAAEVGDVDRLTYLYLLTVSDIRGTNPDLWNDWRSSLLAELFRRTRQWLEYESKHRSQGELEDQQIQETRMEALRLLAQDSIDEMSVLKAWEQFHTEYFRRHDATTAAWHTRLVLGQVRDDRGPIDIIPCSHRGVTEIAIYAKAHPRIFSLATRSMEQLGLNIIDARIYTTRDRMALDTFSVLDTNGTVCTDDFRIAEIRERLEALVTNPENAVVPHQRHLIPFKLKSFHTPVEIRFATAPNKAYTVLDLTAADRPGLLADIAAVLHESGVRIRMARIATVSEQAQDILHVANSDGEPLTQSQQLQLKQKLVEVLEPVK
ncbi:MAG: [protein-PII] uridylyltransferase [Thiotrichales bacterium]